VKFKIRCETDLKHHHIRIPEFQAQFGFAIGTRTSSWLSMERIAAIVAAVKSSAL
jgi:hypothetical protein